MLELLRSKVRSASRTVSDGLAVAATQISRTSRQTVLISRYAVTQASSMTGAQMKSGALSFTSGVVLGSFSQDESIAGHAGRVVGGVIPFYGTVASVRDCVAAAHRLTQGDKAAGLNLTLGVLGLFPGARLATNAVLGAQTAVRGATRFKSVADQMERMITDATQQSAPKRDAADDTSRPQAPADDEPAPAEKKQPL